MPVRGFRATIWRSITTTSGQIGLALEQQPQPAAHHALVVRQNLMFIVADPNIDIMGAGVPGRFPDADDLSNSCRAHSRPRCDPRPRALQRQCNPVLENT